MQKRKLLLKCGLSLGDIVMLTAAVRDLHIAYPGSFLTDVKTPFPTIWENNPHITPLSTDDPEVEIIDCSYPLINRCNNTPYHCLHGFIEFLNERLNLAIRPSVFKGDIYLSGLEKSWFSQVYELTNANIPFWIVAAGGKYDVTIKWWESGRYQAVVDHFKDKIQFVQVGDRGHHHPKLSGTIDLRGKTDLRQLIRLVHHAQGILCSVTGLMHLCSAVETKSNGITNRPCVVVAGGREPAHWEAYPDHQFIHTNGALACCQNGGCWKDRTVRLNDGDERDQKNRLCVDVAEGIARCMSMITPAHVISRIKTYFDGGVLRYLNATEGRAADGGVRASSKNSYDEQSLNLSSAGLACDAFIKQIPPYPDIFKGRGIVICGGGARYFTNAWVCINMLRRHGCHLPIELWYLGERELDDEMKAVIEPLNVKCVDAFEMRKKFPIRRLGGWESKAYAILHSKFQEVIFLDADNVPVANPEYLFDSKEYQKTGAIFWPDYDRPAGHQPTVWKSCGIRRPKEPEFESGQIVVDKKRCWEALSLAVWFNANSDFYYQYIHGDKETFHLAFRKLKTPYSLVHIPIHTLEATMCQHDFDGRRIFQHRNMDKWDYLLMNRKVEDFWLEQECHDYIVQLRRVWDGGCKKLRKIFPRRSFSIKPRKTASIAAVMTSFGERKRLRKQTIKNLQQTDWGDRPIHIQIDTERDLDDAERYLRCAYLALKKGLNFKTDFILLIADDLEFNQQIGFNLDAWEPLQRREGTVATLYNFHARELAFDVARHTRIIDPGAFTRSRAYLFSRESVRLLLNRWKGIEGSIETKIWHLTRRLNQPVYSYAPSLAQHVGTKSICGNHFHRAPDFDANWVHPDHGPA
ncbi:MAG TPA: glycosyltransferase family 9 protein [Verrucomicrobiae bacterium]|jgi:ADP-heptose:LPS heptosyltransferase|nr:glycosyltransferase family 9 protein [Verrucomicrobiae bacterium]